MYTRLLVNFFVVIFGINCAFVGIVMDWYWIVVLSVVNIVALFVILFQNSALFVSVFPEERILFSRDVFGWLAIWFGGIATYFFVQWEGSTEFFLYALLWGGFFYVLSVWLFRMAPRVYRSRWYINSLIVVLIGVFIWTQSAWIARQYGDDLAMSKDSLVGQIERGRNGLVALLTPTPDMEAGIAPSTNVAKTGDTTITATGNVVVETGAVADTPKKLFSIDGREGQVLTYSSFLPALVEVYQLTAAPSAPVFTQVSPTSSLYEPYRIAHAKRMIGTYTHPASEIKCKHLMVLLGLAEGWTVTPSETIFAAYWNQAQSKGYLIGGCTDPENLAHWEDLP